MNTGINRGYSRDVLDESGRAYVFASSCGPVIYRGDNFPKDFVGNAFVCDPALNLIKRNLVFDENLTLRSRFAYPDREFMASTDERFRPVNAFNGPDGTLWLVDMYRGIAQYGMFMTEYLKKETLERDLQKGTHLGRIYRVVSNEKPPSQLLQLSAEDSSSLVSRLGHANGWVRDTAQRLLVERRDLSAVDALLNAIQSGSNPLHQIHALWTIEELYSVIPTTPRVDSTTDSIQLISLKTSESLAVDPKLPKLVFVTCMDAISSSTPKVQVTALRVTESLSKGSSARQNVFLLKLLHLTDQTAPSEVLFQAALSAGNLPKPQVIPVLAKIATEAIHHLIVREAVVTGLHHWELQFLQYLLSDPAWIESQHGRSAMLQALAGAIIKEAIPTKVELLLSLISEQDKEEIHWRRQSLLEGIAVNARSRVTKTIHFNKQPKALTILERDELPRNKTLLDQSMALFTWGDRKDEPSSEGSVKTTAIPQTEKEAKSISDGKALYQQVCAGCHGLNGEGLKPLAPPLANSEWLSESSERLIRILLQGITGPVQVNGSSYQPPEILPEMPALAVLDDHQIADVLSYISNQWGTSADSISSEHVAKIRSETSSRSLPWTQEELLQIE
ncbi:MAG: c-type cytochrome [Verrucomicrobia bacterium]|nr:c-type cytochrome [Verrucomicrobiota bacterium]